MDRRSATIFIDCLFLLLLVLVLLPHKPSEAEHDDAPLGNLVAQIRWCDHCHTDVDLWVKSPNDAAVGYSRLRGRVFSLFRDELGGGPNPERVEVAASHVIPDGEYVVNLHLYNDLGDHAPVAVEVDVWYRMAQKKFRIWRDNVVLEYVGQEQTVVRFHMNDGRLAADSVHHAPISIIRISRGEAQPRGF